MEMIELRISALNAKLMKAKNDQDTKLSELNEVEADLVKFVQISETRDENRSEEQIQWLTKYPSVKVSNTMKK